MLAEAQIIEGHVLELLAGLPAQSVQCCLTSPPYWGLRDYKLPPQVWGGEPECLHEWGIGATAHRAAYGADIVNRSGGSMGAKKREGETVSQGCFCRCGAWQGCLGLEPTIDLYLEHLLAVFEAVHRVLRDDGTLWVNLGDSYAGAGWQDEPTKYADRGRRPAHPVSAGLKPLDLCNVPARFALRMQEAGWYHRSTIIWAKGLSFCPAYSGSVMPESLNGWRWEQHRVKVGRKQADGGLRSWDMGEHRHGDPDRHDGEKLNADWAPCPGCSKCEPNGGLVLSKAAWRPTAAHEVVLFFSKGPVYFCDAEAAREESSGVPEYHAQARISRGHQGARPAEANRIDYAERQEMAGRNLRNVWAIGAQPFPEAHFATYPEGLVKPIIEVATPERGVCPECGAPWARIVEREADYSKWKTQRENHQPGAAAFRLNPPGCISATLGWRPTCACRDDPDAHVLDEGGELATDPATVLDPFAGSGTTGLVARKLGRRSIGLELSAAYAAMARKRIGEYAPLFAEAEE